MIALYIFLYFLIGLMYGAFYKAFADDLPNIGEMILWPVFIAIRLIIYIIIAVIFVFNEIIFAFKDF